jgi:hypothetical protein
MQNPGARSQEKNGKMEDRRKKTVFRRKREEPTPVNQTGEHNPGPLAFYQDR